MPAAGDPLDALDPELLHAPAQRAARERAERRRARSARAPRRAPSRPWAALSPLLGSRSGCLLVALAAALLLATLAGLALLWPGAAADRRAAAPPTLAAEVAALRTAPCPGPAAQACATVVVRLREGADRGATSAITLGPVGQTTRLAVGDHVRVSRTAVPAGAGTGVERYGLAGVERRGAIGWLLGAFVLLVLLFARWRGLLALVGFALSIGLVTQFLVPAMLAGSSPVLVALTGSLAVMFVTLGLTYGVAPASLAAALGITAALALGAGLSRLWVGLAHLDGRSSELGALLVQRGSGLSLQGVVLAGMVIGALGVLADTGVTQASAVLALRRASPGLGGRAVYREALAVGRDHLTATIHTLVLAYVGASLPLILVLSQAGVPTVDALNSEDIAEPVVATLVGSVALLASVPLTTALAALLITRIPAAALPAGDGHAHHHA